MSYEKNTRTLIASFSDYSTAVQAARELNASGVPQDAVHIDSNQKTAGASSSGYEADDTADQHRSGFSEWWHSLFGSDREQDARKEYEGALASGGAILRAVVDEELTNASTQILNRYGAAEIETRSESANAAFGNTDQPSPGASSSGSLRVFSHDTLHPPAPRSAAHLRGTTTRRGSDLVPSGFGTTPGESTLAGASTAGSAIQDFSFQDFSNNDYTEDFRRHYEENYQSGGGFQSMLPAYEYGARSARDERFRKMSWDEAESEVRSEYQKKPAGSDWTDARAAVQYGWTCALRKR